MDSESRLLTYAVLTFVVAIAVMIVTYDGISSVLDEHQIITNVSVVLGIMVGIATSLTVHQLQQHFNKRKIQV